MKIDMKFGILTIALLLLASTSAFADNTGCGLGTMLMKGRSGKMFEILAVTTNDATGTPTSAITSGTSEYKAGAQIGYNEVEKYVDENMDMLARDMSKGSGEHLDALAAMMQVEDKASFNLKMRENFNNIYTTENVTSREVVSNIVKIKNS